VLYKEILARVDFGVVINLLRDIYNEFKFEATMEMNLDITNYNNLAFLVEFIAYHIQYNDWEYQPINRHIFGFFSQFEWDSVE
jgi:hypothetical protein